MKISKSIIVTKLSNYSIPNGQCGTMAFEIATILFSKKVDGYVAKVYGSLDDVFADVSKCLAREQIAILWLDSGLMDISNPHYHAIHCFFIFDENPLQSFTVWPSPGPQFLTEDEIREKITKSIAVFQSDGGIRIHFVPTIDAGQQAVQPDGTKEKTLTNFETTKIYDNTDLSGKIVKFTREHISPGVRGDSREDGVLTYIEIYFTDDTVLCLSAAGETWYGKDFMTRYKRWKPTQLIDGKWIEISHK